VKECNPYVIICLYDRGGTFERFGFEMVMNEELVSVDDL